VLFEPLLRYLGSAYASLRADRAHAERLRRRTVSIGLLAAGAVLLYRHPPFATAHRGEVLVRGNVLDGSASAYSAGTIVVLPGLHQLRRYSTRDQLYRPVDGASASGRAPFQSTEGLSIGVDLAVRWSIDRSRIAALSRELPEDLN